MAAYRAILAVFVIAIAIAAPAISGLPTGAMPDEEASGSYLSGDASRSRGSSSSRQESTSSSRGSATLPSCGARLSNMEMCDLLTVIRHKARWIENNASLVTDLNTSTVASKFYPVTSRPDPSGNDAEAFISSSSRLFYCYIDFVSKAQANAMKEETPSDNGRRQRLISDVVAVLDVYRDERALVRGSGGLINACELPMLAQACPTIPDDQAGVDVEMHALVQLGQDVYISANRLLQLRTLSCP